MLMLAENLFTATTAVPAVPMDSLDGKGEFGVPSPTGMTVADLGFGEGEFGASTSPLPSPAKALRIDLVVKKM